MRYHDIEILAPSVALERHHELSVRASLALVADGARARGEALSPTLAGAVALTVAERLEMLAMGEYVARYAAHPSDIHDALMDGASWEEIADAVGKEPVAVREGYRAWADRQHVSGLISAEDHRAAVQRSA